MVLGVLCLLVLGIGVARGQRDSGPEICLPATWLPEGAETSSCSSHGVLYDGSKVPNCSAAFQGGDSNTTFFHAHEYGEILVLHDFSLRLWSLLDVCTWGPMSDDMPSLQRQPNHMSWWKTPIRLQVQDTYWNQRCILVFRSATCEFSHIVGCKTPEPTTTEASTPTSPSYLCPMRDTDFPGADISIVAHVSTWQECGMLICYDHWS